MFNCTACSFNPLKYLFPDDTDKNESDTINQDDEKRYSSYWKKWIVHLHPRAETLYPNVPEILKNLANILKTAGDPILDNDDCVIWPGEFVNGLPTINVNGQFKTVISLLVEFFSDDDSFELMLKSSVSMSCKNTACVNIHHMLLN